MNLPKRFLSLLVLFVLFVFAGLSLNAQTPGPIESSFDFGLWFSQNWAIVLLILSESLALLPNSQSGILKILIFVFQRISKIQSARNTKLK